MPRYKAIEEGQGLFLDLHLEEQFDEYSLEKTVNRFIEKEADISSFEKNYNNASKGQSAYNPKFLLKVICFAFSKGVVSSRKIEELLHRHISYIYLSANQRFDHSTICRFILINAENIKEIFSKLLYVLNQLELIDWSSLEIDGTIASANAAKSLTGDSSDFEKILKNCEAYTEKLVKRCEYINKGEFSQDYIKEEERKIKRQKRFYENTIEKIKAYQEQVRNKEVGSKEKVNLTDNDSSLLKQRDSKGYTQGYNFHCSFSENDILLDVETQKGSNDAPHTCAKVEQLKQLKDELGVDKQSTFLMDKGFFSSKSLSKLLKRGDDIYIPIPESVKERNVILENSKYYLEHNGELILGHKRKAKDEYRFRYKDLKGKRKEISIVSSFVEDKPLWDSYRQKMNSQKGKFIYAKRIGKEHNHHTLKEVLGMRCIFRRGRYRVNLEALLHGIGYNLGKLNKLVCQKDLEWAAC